MEDYITIETARIAKEKGFRIKTYEYFIGVRPMSTVPQKEDHNRSYGDCGLEYTTRPTQALLQKWLRDEFKIYVSPRESLSFDNTLEFICTVNGKHVNHDIKDKPINRYDKFEEAFEDGLRYGLSLID